MEFSESALENLGGLMLKLDFFENRRVLVTGHTGFKGSWLCRVLSGAGAEVVGFSLPPEMSPSLYEVVGKHEGVKSIIGDIRDMNALCECFESASPEIVIHLAAQPIVKEGYERPRYTYEVNAMGTVNLLECIRSFDCVRSFVNVTTDKVYKNREWDWGYRETERLDGYDPYSNSKSCSELITRCYREALMGAGECAISTARSGNVIGGGDFAPDRIIPDCVRSVSEKKVISVRNPQSTRPYQHVLESVFTYLLIAERQLEDRELAGSYNVGPDESDCFSTRALVELFCRKWGEGARWETISANWPHEAGFLKLDSSYIKRMLGWRPVWSLDMAMEKTVEWYRAFLEGGNVLTCMDGQIREFIRDCPWIV